MPSHSIPYTSSCRKYQASIVNHASIPTPYIKSRRTANKNRGKKCYFTERDFAVGERKRREKKRKGEERESSMKSLVGMVVVMTFMRVC